MKNEIISEVDELLAYFPGKGRIRLIWLVVLPIVALILYWVVVIKMLRFNDLSSEVPYGMRVAAGRSALWIYLPAALACLLRINRAEKPSFRTSSCIILSSILYGIMIGVPAIAVTTIWTSIHLGLSPLMLSHTIFGIFAVCTSTALLVGVLGVAAHYLGFFVPLMLLFVNAYDLFVPISYALTFVPEKWLSVQLLVFPLAPAIELLRNAMLNATGKTLPLCWAGATFHSVLGVAMLMWLWQMASKSEEPQL